MSALQEGNIFSQPATTGAGRLQNTQLASAVDALKREQNPVRMEDFALGLGSGFEPLLDPSSSLTQRFLAHDRVVLNKVNGTLTYRPDYELHSKADLLQLVRDRWDAFYPPPDKQPPPGLRRLPLKPVIKMQDLRESWPDARVAVEQLSKHEPRHDREVLLWKQHKDGLIKGVTWNPIRSSNAGPQADKAKTAGPQQGEESGEAVLMEVDQEFRDLWHQLTSPDEADLQKQLEADGLRMTSILESSGGFAAMAAGGGYAAGAANAPISAFGTKGMIHGDKGSVGAAGRGRGRGRGRGSGRGASTSSSRKPKIQNTHLEGVDLTKDYI